MKRVFNTAAEVAHVWANQLQSDARCRNASFLEETFYSYGMHYEAGKFLTTPNGERVVFINSNVYSNTTTSHTGAAFNAIPDGIKVFRVPFYIDRSYWGTNRQYITIEVLPEIVKKMIVDVKNHCFDQLNARSNFSHFLQARSQYNAVLEICSLFGLPVPAMPDNYEQAKAKGERLQNTYEQREKEKKEKLIEKEKELLKKWLKNEHNGTLYNVPIHFRYVSEKKEIQTTKGAKVSTLEALHVLNLHRKNKDIVGLKISGFTVTKVNPECITIGCHVIRWDVVNEFFK